MASSWSQVDVDALRLAVVSGVLTVRYSGPPERSVTYQSTDQMLKVLALAQQSINVAAGGSSYVLAGTRKGV